MQEVQLKNGQLLFNKRLCKTGLALCVGTAIGISVAFNQVPHYLFLETIPLVHSGYLAKQMWSIEKQLKKLK